jgi:hypothetical protein
MRLERVAWLNGVEADHSGGTAADFHGTSPLLKPANYEFSVRRAYQRVN